MDTNQTNTAATTATTPVHGFAVGELVTLRPVLEGDLPALANLLAGNPSEPDRLPWTHQRLKQKFEDKDAPGLWSGKNRYRVFSIVLNSSGEVAGYLREREDEANHVFWCHFHLADTLEAKPALAADLLKAYHEFMLKWHDALRISFDVLGCEADKAAWLSAAGYELELTRERMVLWLGQPQSICTHTWLSERLKSELAKRDA